MTKHHHHHHSSTNKKHDVKAAANMTQVEPHHTGLPSFMFVFSVLLVVRVVASRFASAVADCDETFNYWEPTHFLMYGYGFQTWEYRYIRSSITCHKSQ
jgi:hypothetical protein